MNLYDIEIDVHKKLDTGAYRVTVRILNKDIGMYIHGNRVFPPNAEHKDWSVLTPAVGKAHIVEFNGKLPLWKEYKQACIDAVQEHIRNEMQSVADDMTHYEGLSQEEFNKKLKDGWKDIPF